MSRLPIPLLSLLYFIMAFIWVIGAVVTYGEPLFWIFLLMIPLNIIVGVRTMNR